MRLSLKFCINGALKSSDRQRVKFRAPYEMMICYFSCTLTKLISGYVVLEVSFEQFHYQQSLSAAAVASEVKEYEEAEKNRSPNDATECPAVHRLGFHLAGLATPGRVVA